LVDCSLVALSPPEERGFAALPGGVPTRIAPFARSRKREPGVLEKQLQGRKRLHGAADTARELLRHHLRSEENLLLTLAGELA